MLENISHTDLEERIRKAIQVAVQHGGHEGAHHKDWVIDQMVRQLTGCPTVQRMSKHKWADGKHHEISVLGESDMYLALVRAACDGEDGPDTYSWEVGIAP